MVLFGKKKHENEGQTVINIDQIVIILGEEKEHHHHHVHKMHPKLAFNLILKNKNFNYMSVVNTLTLTSTAPVTLSMTVVDGTTGNLIAGVLSDLSYVPADSSQDIGVVDPADPLEVDVHAVTNVGGTNLVATGNFVSTLLGSDGVTPAFSGSVTGTLVLVNNIPVAVLNPVLAFNQ